MRIIKRFLPFLAAGLLLTVMVFGFILLAYLILIGTVVGMIMYAISYLRDRFIKPTPKQTRQQPSGRVIDSDEWHKL